MASEVRRRARRLAGIALMLAVPLVAALAATAHAADGPASPPAPSLSIPVASGSGGPPAPTTTAPHTSAASAPTTHRATTSAPHRYHSTTRYEAPATRSSTVPYSISESLTGAPTQTFVLGSASLGSLSTSGGPVVTASPATQPSSSGDETVRYVHLFFVVVVAAAVLLAAGITGLILTRDGRQAGGRHR